MSHAELSPSRLSRIIACPGSVQASREVPEGATSPHALEGTMLHGIVDSGLNNLEPDLTTLTDEQRGLVEEVLEFATSMLPSNGLWGSEARVSLTKYGVDEVWGTCDFHALHTDENNVPLYLDVADWKFGGGEQVFAKDNEQLLAYAAGILAKYEHLFGAFNPNFMIRMHIAQPRMDHFDTDVITFGRLMTWISGVLKPTIPLVEADEPVLIPGKKQCKWCPARFTCKARMSAVQAATVQVFAAHADLKVNTLSHADLREILAQCELAEKAAADIRRFFFMEMSKGVKIPGFKLVRGRANRTWAKPEDEVVEALTALGLDLEDVYKTTLKGPGALEKLRRDLKKSTDFQNLVVKPLGKITCVPDSDPREEVSGALSTEEIFASVVDEEG